jgi:HK97 family phage portal protein
MTLWDRVTQFFSLQPVLTGRDLETRAIDSFTDYPGLEEQLLAVQGLTPRPWRAASVKEALGVPSIFRAVSLISNTTGSLGVEAFRNGALLADTPKVVQRPDPFRTPRAFYRDTAYYLATRGEAWWWVGARDVDGQALSLIVVPPWEVEILDNDQDRLRPTIKWLGREMRREDMRQITFLPDGSGYRGVGPLQMCGAAISVSVESQEWAANFYASGGYPNIWIKKAGALGGGMHAFPGADESAEDAARSEAQRLKEQWVATPNNMPHVSDDTIEDIKQFDPNPQGAQMLDARRRQDAEAAQMFGIPGALLEYTASGASLTYQNVTEVYTQFVRTSLAPNYLEPIEQELSDLLTRSTVARFNVAGVLRADIKTRFDVYGIGIDKGILTPEEARQAEGMAPGNVEYAPVPMAPPQAIPNRVPPETRSSGEVRCDGMVTKRRAGVSRIEKCNRLLTKTGKLPDRCPRCKKEYAVAA